MGTPRTDTEVLEAALDIIQQEGAWCKNSWFRDEDGDKVTEPFYASSYCLEGAIQVATLKYQFRDNPECLEQERRVKRLLQAIIKERGLNRDDDSCAIPTFNDRDETTKEDAALLLKYGIEAASQQENV